jgi:ribonuclease HII
MSAPVPSLDREVAAWSHALLLVGVDEVGRGPLAGPVVAAAVVFPPNCSRIRGIRDSKMLPAERRNSLTLEIRHRALGIGVGAASTREIDRLNIRVATAVAMRRAMRALFRRLPLTPRAPARIDPGAHPTPARDRRRRIELAPFSPEACLVLLDGLPLPEVGVPHDALVDGDAHCMSIAAAGIVAKTVRDDLMSRLARRYPGYGWETNMGYGTPGHHDGLREHGPCIHHRHTFAPIAQLQLF